MATMKLDVNGTAIQVESEAPSGQVQAGAMQELEARFDDALIIINQMATSCNQAFSGFSEEFRPTQTKISFGLKVSGEANWVVGKLGGEAVFQVDLSWESPKTEAA
jgi:hypothetical protein